MVNVHPWELDPEQPRIAAPARSRFFHYTGLERTGPLLESLFSAHAFAPLRELLDGGAA